MDGCCLPGNPEKLAVLQRLLEDEPVRTDVRIEMASAQALDRQFQQALATLQKVESVSREDAPHLFRLLMNVQLGNGNREDAKKAAERLLQVSRDPRDQAEAERLIKLLESGGEIRPQLRGRWWNRGPKRRPGLSYGVPEPRRAQSYRSNRFPKRRR
jgi:hypothetical protein